MLWNLHFRIVESSQLSGLHNLSSLILSHNEIDSIEDGAFEFLSSLKILDLSHNPVSSWSPTAFRVKFRISIS